MAAAAVACDGVGEGEAQRGHVVVVACGGLR